MAAKTTRNESAAQAAEQLTPLFQLLADKTRLHILHLLAQGERNVMSLCRDLSVLQPTVSHHLAVLRDHGLVLNRRNGKEVVYSLQPRAAAIDGELVFTVASHVIRVKPAAPPPAGG